MGLTPMLVIHSTKQAAACCDVSFSPMFRFGEGLIEVRSWFLRTATFDVRRVIENMFQ
jgi:hypothetical protein